MSRGMWETMETGAREIGMGEAEGGRGKRGSREKEKKKKQKKERTIEVRKVVEEWEIWNKEEEAAKSEAEAKKLVPEKFHRWIKMFGKKQSERMLTRKVWDHVIDVKEGVCSKEGKSVPIVERRERGGEGVCEGTVEKGIHSAIQVTTNGAGVLCRKERWEEEDGTGLQILE